MNKPRITEEQAVRLATVLLRKKRGTQAEVWRHIYDRYLVTDRKEQAA